MAIIDGTDGPENIADTALNDFIDAMDGNDTISVTYGRDSVDGGGGDDVLVLRWSDSLVPVYTDNSRALPGTRTYADTDGSWADSARRVQHNNIDHYDVVSGSGADELVGWYNAWDKFDGRGGIDLWRDGFAGLTAGMVVDMAVVSGSVGTTFADGTMVRNIERADLRLTQGNDVFRDFDALDDSIDSGDGNDIVRFSGGNDYGNGGAGEDVLVVDWGDATNTVYTDNNRNLPGTRTYEDTDGSWAASQRSILHNGFEHYDVTAGSGNDDFTGWTNSWDKFDGGTGTDRWRDSFAGWTEGVNINLGVAATDMGQTYADGTTVKRIETANLTLTEHNDRFRDFRNNDDSVTGGDGNDNIGFSGGNDYANGGEGDDVLVLDWRDATNAVYTSNSRALPGTRTYEDTDGSWATSQRSVLHNGMDHYNVRAGSGDDDLTGWTNAWDKFNGGGGTDLWRDSFAGFSEGLSVSMKAASSKKGLGLDDGSVLKNIERASITLTEFGDTFSDYRDHDDSVSMLGGKDTIIHQNGRDYANGGEGKDTLKIKWGKTTDDSIVENWFDSYAYVDTPNFWVNATRRIDFTEIEMIHVTFGSGDDRASVWNAKDRAIMGAGDDTAIMRGGADLAKGGLGNDLLEGGDGNDRLDGGRGKDIMIGGNGADILTGGAGGDSFVYQDLMEGRDRLTEFQLNRDMFDLSGLGLTEADVSIRTLRKSGDTLVEFGETRITIDDLIGRGGLTIDDFDLI